MCETRGGSPPKMCKFRLSEVRKFRLSLTATTVVGATSHMYNPVICLLCSSLDPPIRDVRRGNTCAANMVIARVVHPGHRFLNGRERAVRLPLTVCRALYAVASRACGETILTYDELRGLASNRMDSTQSVLYTTSLLASLEERAGEVGLRFAREPRRGEPLPQPPPFAP